MRNIALTLKYLGTAYHGWQVQKTVPTVGQTTYAAPTLGGASSETSGADDAPAAAPAAPAPQAAASADAEPVTIPSAGGYAIPTYLRSSGS